MLFLWLNVWLSLMVNGSMVLWIIRAALIIVRHLKWSSESLNWKWKDEPSNDIRNLVTNMRSVMRNVWLINWNGHVGTTITLSWNCIRRVRYGHTESEHPEHEKDIWGPNTRNMEWIYWIWPPETWNGYTGSWLPGTWSGYTGSLHLNVFGSTTLVRP